MPQLHNQPGGIARGGFRTSTSVESSIGLYAMAALQGPDDQQMRSMMAGLFVSPPPPLPPEANSREPAAYDPWFGEDVRPYEPSSSS